MSNRQRAEARRKAQAKAARRGQSLEGENAAGFTINVWVIVVVVLALATGGVIWAASGGDSDATDKSNTGSNVDLLDLPDSQPVTITGEELPTFDPDDTKNISPVGELPDVGVGLAAPKLSGLDFQGDVVTVDPGLGGPYMIVFLAHWCPHCNAEMPRLNDWKARGAVPAELTVIGVATAVRPDSANYPPAEWFSNKGWSWPVLVDESEGDGGGRAASAYGLSGFPYFVIVGADGLVKARASGELEVSQLETIVDQALAS